MKWLEVIYPALRVFMSLFLEILSSTGALGASDRAVSPTFRESLKR